MTEVGDSEALLSEGEAANKIGSLELRVALPIFVLLALPICFLLCVCVRFQGKTGLYLRWRFSHSSPQMPFGYMAKERRGLLRQRLSGTPPPGDGVRLNSFQTTAHEPACSAPPASVSELNVPPPQPVGDLGEHNVDVDLDELDDLITVSGQVRPSSTLSEHSDPARGLAPSGAGQVFAQQQYSAFLGLPRPPGVGGGGTPLGMPTGRQCTSSLSPIVSRPPMRVNVETPAGTTPPISSEAASRDLITRAVSFTLALPPPAQRAAEILDEETRV